MKNGLLAGGCWCGVKNDWSSYVWSCSDNQLDSDLYRVRVSDCWSFDVKLGCAVKNFMKNFSYKNVLCHFLGVASEDGNDVSEGTENQVRKDNKKDIPCFRCCPSVSSIKPYRDTPCHIRNARPSQPHPVVQSWSCLELEK